MTLYFFRFADNGPSTSIRSHSPEQAVRDWYTLHGNARTIVAVGTRSCTFPVAGMTVTY